MNGQYSFGPQITRDGIAFRLWAPAARRVELVTDGTVEMSPVGEGWFQCLVPEARAGIRYRFRIDGNLTVPDPASAHQPDDVFGPSEVVDFTDFRWQAENWRGRQWRDAVIVETHVGTFTPAGTFRGATDKLDHLADAGFTAIELMPVADFAGRWNWGYDGVLLYAPDHRYGRPEELMALVDAAHQRGLMVLLDVVYNHFGPEGNFLASYAPQFFTESHHTPWGAAIDYRVPQVRRFAIENALHWLERYRFDGLRLDAVHAITEPGEPNILVELSRAVGELAERSDRLIHLILENDDNRVSLLDPDTAMPAGRYRAQWNDDFHHAVHAALTGERGGYYQDYAADPHGHVARILSSGFSYQGETSVFRGNARRGEKSGTLPPAAFVNFIQNHDQIGNRPYGDRLVGLAKPGAVNAALALLLLAPMPVLMYMGEEWGSQRPFPFFCDFHGALADAVREGRKREFSEAYADLGHAVPDPLSEETVRAATLDWAEMDLPQHRERLAYVKELLAIRRKEIVPAFADIGAGAAKARTEGAVVHARWHAADGKSLSLIANLGDAPAALPSEPTPARPIWGSAPAGTLAPWSVFWSVGGE